VLASATALAIGAVAAVLRLLNPALTELARLYGGADFTIPMLSVQVLAGLILAGLSIGFLLGTLGVGRPHPPKP
jgi:hypothetical protein